MLTGMTEDDWAIVLKVFAAAQSRCGQPGKNDRKFLQALHFFTVHNLTWRALPATFGLWNSIWKRFWRLSRSGVMEAFFQLLAETSKTTHLVQMLDSTTVRAHVSAAGAFDGLPIAFHLTGGEVHDTTQFTTSLDIGPDTTPRAVVTDKGYDSKKNRTACRERGIIAVIPYRATTKDKPKYFPKRLYRGRARIEQAIGKLKRFKRIAMRCEKTAESFAAFVAFACGLILVKSVHRA